MCGIVGVINHKVNGLSHTDKNIFKRLLFLDVERGPDSTGVFSVKNNGEVDLLKEASSSPVFLENKEVEDLLQKAVNNGTFLVGHNRKATQGAVTDDNAHPFAVENIVLVHNGSLFNHKAIANVAVDSHALAIALNKNNNDVAETFKDVHGAYACVWYNNTDKSLNFFRNKERPLWLYRESAYTLFASEWLMLYYALLKEGEKFDHKNLVELAPNTHVSYKVHKSGGAERDFTESLLEKPNFPCPPETIPPSEGFSKTGGTEPLSLNMKKKLRNQFLNFLQKHPVGSTITFIPEDWKADDNGWLLLGTVEGCPDHIHGCAAAPGMSEEDCVSLCCGEALQLSATILGNEIDHKNMLFQLNVKLDPTMLTMLSETSNETTCH